MGDGKTDRRTKYTKLALRDGMVKLLRHKPADKITVKELCETADVNRSTFYAYYGSPAELVRQMERELLRDIEGYLADCSARDGVDAISEKIVMIFEYVARNAELCMTILGENGNVRFQKELMTLIQSKGIIIQEYANDSEINEYLLTFVVSGSIGVVQNWFRSGMKRPPREVARMLTDFTYHGLSAQEGAAAR